MLVNAICIKFQQIDAVGMDNSVDRIPDRTATFEIKNHTIYNKPAEFIFGSLCNPSIMAPILECMEGMPQSGLEILLDQHCKLGTCVASFSTMHLLQSWNCKKYDCPVGVGELSWMDALKTINIYVYKNWK